MANFALLSCVADSELSSTRSAFSLKFNSALWLCTAGLQFVVGWWYRKSAVFYLPPGWFGPLTWWLSFPFAPAGSVSCGIWQMSCRRVIKLGERMVKELSAGTTRVLGSKCSAPPHHDDVVRTFPVSPDPQAVPDELQEKKSIPTKNSS